MSFGEVFFDDALQMSFNFEYGTDTVRSAFSSSAQTMGGRQRDASSPEKKAHFYWKVANYSLVVPFTLGVLILFVAFRGVENESESLHSAFKADQERRDDLVKKYADLQSAVQ